MSKALSPKRCKDCVVGAKKPRPAPYPGPRCATHHKAQRKGRKGYVHETHVQETYGLLAGDYAKLYKAQGNKCAICRRATGATRKLAVDHCHADGFARGLLCRPCNRMLGHGRDSSDFFQRAANYLEDPPALQVLGERLHIDFR
jgi:hypothetical protein